MLGELARLGFGFGGGGGADGCCNGCGCGRVPLAKLSSFTASSVNRCNKMLTIQSCPDRYSSESLARSAEALSSTWHKRSESLSL